LTDEVSSDPDSVSRVSFLEAKPVEKTYLSHQKHNFPSVQLSLPTNWHMLGVQFMTRLETNLWTAATRYDTTENTIISSHTEDTIALEHKPEYIGYWSWLFNGLIFPIDTTTNVKGVLMGLQRLVPLACRYLLPARAGYKSYHKTEAALVCSNISVSSH